jgi:hypothetical protein
MRDFRNEVLEYLLTGTGQFMDLKHLTDKYCGTENTFEIGDETIIKCRLNVNMVLRELENMKWINLTPIGGMSNSHIYNQALNKREFVMDSPVKARLTTLGETEYKKLKKLDQPSQSGHTISVNGNINAPISVATDKAVQTVSIDNETKKEKPKEFWQRIGKFIWENLLKIITAVISGYILYRFGWKK